MEEKRKKKNRDKMASMSRTSASIAIVGYDEYEDESSSRHRDWSMLSVYIARSGEQFTDVVSEWCRMTCFA
jgi:hypothetical protein